MSSFTVTDKYVHQCTMRVREVARVEHPDIRDDEHGGLMFGGGFKYESGGGQGWGVRIDTEFIQKIMAVFGYPRNLRDINGLACWVTHCHSAIHLVEPLLTSEGKPFDVDKWANEASARGTALRDLKLDQWSIDKIAREAQAERLEQ